MERAMEAERALASDAKVTVRTEVARDGLRMDAPRAATWLMKAMPTAADGLESV